jgi:PAS domain S-box-containing protein
MDVQDVPRDLAATRQAFANLQTTQNDRLGSIIEIQRAVGATDLDVDAVMRVICTRTQVLTHAESAAILILDGDGFELRVATGFLEDEIGARVPLVGTQPGWMHLHDQSGLLGDAKTDPRAGPLARSTGMRSGIAVQLRHREQKIGQLIVVSRQPGAFTQVDVERLERLSDILSVALVHAAEFETKGQQVEALARFETIYQSAAIGITLVSPVGRYLDANPAFQLMSGFSMDELALMSPFDQTHPDDVASIEESIRSLSTGMRGKTDLEVRFFHKDGRLRWGHITTTVQREPGGAAPQFSISMIEDITERKEAEEQVARALTVERDATQRLRAVDEMKNTFLQAVSHDLRTPLAAILGLAITLERGDIGLESQEIHELASRIAANARKLDRLVTNLLDLDRLARGIVEPKLHPTEVSELVGRVVAESDLAAAGRVSLDLQPVTANVDAAKVERIVENLLANASRYTPEGSTVWVRVRPEDGGVTIVVDDEGPGIAGGMREAVFEPFRQGPGAPEHAPGVGVGLALVSRFAELMGGRAWVDESPAGGASFRVYLADGPRTSAEVGTAG